MSISGNMVGSYSQIGRTFILEDSDGNTIEGVVVDQMTVFDATPEDVIVGKTFASNEGVKVGENTKTYRVTKASRLVFPNMSYAIPLSHYNQYDYTKFQCIIAKYNTSLSDSVYTNKISIEDNIYEVNSIDVLSSITKNTDEKSIDLNITNDTVDTYIIHYFTYKEEY